MIIIIIIISSSITITIIMIIIIIIIDINNIISSSTMIIINITIIIVVIIIMMFVTNIIISSKVGVLLLLLLVIIMPCYPMLHYPILCRATLRCAVLHYAMPQVHLFWYCCWYCHHCYYYFYYSSLDSLDYSDSILLPSALIAIWTDSPYAPYAEHDSLQAALLCLARTAACMRREHTDAGRRRGARSHVFFVCLLLI